jgi:hypothetical protein
MSTSPQSPPNLIPRAPPNPHNNARPLQACTIEEDEGIMLSQALEEATRVAYEDCLYGRESSVEGDCSENDNEVASMEGGDLEEMLGWQPELFIAPDERNRCYKFTILRND